MELKAGPCRDGTFWASAHGWRQKQQCNKGGGGDRGRDFVGQDPMGGDQKQGSNMGGGNECGTLWGWALWAATATEQKTALGQLRAGPLGRGPKHINHERATQWGIEAYGAEPCGRRPRRTTAVAIQGRTLWVGPLWAVTRRRVPQRLQLQQHDNSSSGNNCRGQQRAGPCGAGSHGPDPVGGG